MKANNDNIFKSIIYTISTFFMMAFTCIYIPFFGTCFLYRSLDKTDSTNCFKIISTIIPYTLTTAAYASCIIHGKLLEWNILGVIPIILGFTGVISFLCCMALCALYDFLTDDKHNKNYREDDYGW